MSDRSSKSFDPTVSRRGVLAVGASGAGLFALAACSSSKSDSTPAPAAPDNSSAAAPAPSTSSAASSPDTASSATTSSAATSSSAAAPPSGLAKLSYIQVGQAVSATVDGKPAIIARPTATTAAGFSAICTHMGCTVAPAGAQLHCPCHGSIYNAVTGAVIQGPAPAPLPKIAVHVVDGEVVAGA